MFCTQCGSELPDGVTHCLVCGAPARIVLPRPAAQAAQPPDPAAPGPAMPNAGPEGLQGVPAPGSEGRASTPGPAYQSAQPGPEGMPGAPGGPTAPGPRYAAPSPGGPACAPSQPGPAYQQPTPQPGPAGQGPPLPPPAGSAYSGGGSYPAYQQYVQRSAGSDSPETVGMGEWLLADLLMVVPIVNIILLFIWGFGSGYKPSKKNWARAQLIVVAVSTAVGIFLGTAVFGWLMSDLLPYLY